MRNAAILSYWSTDPADKPINLLGQIRAIPAGIPFDLRVSCNGDSLSVKFALEKEEFFDILPLESPDIVYFLGAIASEIAISQKARETDYRVRAIGPNNCFNYITGLFASIKYASAPEVLANQGVNGYRPSSGR